LFKTCAQRPDNLGVMNEFARRQPFPAVEIREESRPGPRRRLPEESLERVGSDA
jgi:hypothetical protein